MKINFLKINYKKILLILTLLFIFLLIYSPHKNYSYPLHVDEWHHISQSIKLAEGDYNFRTTSSLEVGYHLFLATLYKIGFNLVLIYKFLPALFAVFSALTLFILMYYLTQDYFTSLFSIIFFASLKSNVNLLGLWFATPLTFAIPFLFLSIFFLCKGLKEDKSQLFYIHVFLTALLLVIHPPTAIFTIVISLIYLTTEFYRKRNLMRKSLPTLAIGGIVISIIVLFLILLSEKNIIWFLSQLLFKRGWTPLELGLETNSLTYNFLGKTLLLNQYFLPILFGIVPFFLALWGLYYSLKKRKLRIFPIWMIYSALTLFLFNFLDFSPLVPHQRMIYYSLLGLTCLAGIGTNQLFQFLTKKTGKKITTILLILLFIWTFNSYGIQNKETELYYLINQEDYNALNYLKTIDQNKIILSPIEPASAIYPLSKNHAIADLYFIGDQKTRDEIKTFFQSSCETKEQILKKYKAEYVYSNDRINCNFLREIYNKQTFIYKTK